MSQVQSLSASASNTAGTGELHFMKVAVPPGSSGSGTLVVKVKQGELISFYQQTFSVSRVGEAVPGVSTSEASGASTFDDAPEIIAEGIAGGLLDIYVTNAPSGSVVQAWLTAQFYLS